MKHRIVIQVSKKADELLHATCTNEMPGLNVADVSTDGAITKALRAIGDQYRGCGVAHRLTVADISVNVDVELLPASTVRTGEPVWYPEPGSTVRIENTGSTGLPTHRSVLSKKDGGVMVDGIGMFTLRHHGRLVKSDHGDTGPYLAEA